MREQIEEDFADFSKTGVTERGLAGTLNQCLHKGGQDESSKFTRYRIVNNQIFRSNHDIWLDYFDGALLQLAKMVKLPNVDFILCLHDGIVATHHEQRPVNLATDDLYWVTQNREDQAPVFVRARQKRLPYIILLPDYSAFSFLQTLIPTIEKANRKYPWKTKRKMALWRGFASERAVIPTPMSGVNHNIRPRLALCIYSSMFPDTINAGMIEPPPSIATFAPESSQIVSQSSLRKEYIPMGDQLAYAYLPCLDGIVCTYPGLYYRLLSNSVVLKAESADELWYYRLLKPFVHYVPLASDCSDIVDVVKWSREHDSLCEQIANAATELVRSHLSEEDNYLYVLYAIEHYARLQKFNTKDLWHDTINNPKWRKIK